MNSKPASTTRIILAATALLLLATGASGAQIEGAGDGVTLYELLTFLHVVLFVFWLGPDIGVYMWSRKAVAVGIGPEQRAIAGRMMRKTSLVGRVSMSLMLTIGGFLSEFVGITHPWWQMAGIVLLGPVWLTLVLAAAIRDGELAGATAERLETWLRWLVVIAIPLSVVYSIATSRLHVAPYVGTKLLLFAGIVLLGLLLNRWLRPFWAGLERYEAGEEAPEQVGALSAALDRAGPVMIAIWLMLLAAALLGVIQPGAPAQITLP